MTDLSKAATDLSTHINRLARRFSPANKRALVRRFLAAKKRDTRQAMMRQQAPDGSPWAPRTGGPRKGRPKKMMAGLARSLMVKADATGGTIGWPGKAGHIARIHHEGGLDDVGPDGPRIRMAMRELIGWTGADEQALIDLMLDALQKR